jgi:Spy/CpxP family protein refolding chaperone
MNRFRLLAIGAMLVITFTVSAQSIPAAAGIADQPEQGQPAPQNSPAAVEQHLQAMSAKLDLTADQQAKLRPIVQQMMDDRQKLMQDSTLSNEARAEKEKALHEKAVKQARVFLNDDQKRKLDELQQQPHP